MGPWTCFQNTRKIPVYTAYCKFLTYGEVHILDENVERCCCVSGILKEVMGKCVDGATVIDVCQFGDARLMEETAKVFKKDKEMKKGIL